MTHFQKIAQQRQTNQQAMANEVRSQKVRENRLRRAAARQGLRLVKSRLRDPRAIGYGGYMLVDAERNVVVLGEINSARSLDLDAVEQYLTADRDANGGAE